MEYKRTGKMLRRFRISHMKMTQVQMAQEYGIHSQQVSNYERGSCLVPIPVMRDAISRLSDHEVLMLKGFLKADLIDSYWKRFLR